MSYRRRHYRLTAHPPQRWANSASRVFLGQPPSDLFFLGTNHQGIGPLQDGEHAVIEIDRIGRLEFNVSDPLKRRWPKEVDEVSARDVREGTGGPGRRTRP